MLESVSGSECLVGWRGWNLLHPHYLVGGNLVYEPRKRHEAKCGLDHLAPDEKCSCGIYSFKTAEELKKQNYNSQKVLGEVLLWGKVVEHAVGYKAQYAYPRKLYFSSVSPLDRAMNVDGASLAPYISFLYGVSYEIIGSDHELLRKIEVARLPPSPRPKIGAFSNPDAKRNVYYQVTGEGMKTHNLAALPPQAVCLVRLMTLAMKDQNPVPERKFIDAVMAAGKSGSLKTRQHPWHIFMYYRGKLLKEGLILMSKGRSV